MGPDYPPCRAPAGRAARAGAGVSALARRAQSLDRRRRRARGGDRPCLPCQRFCLKRRARMTDIETLQTDILIIGAGGAGLMAALHAAQANPDLSIAIAVKGLLGKCGCTRMVQGGYNVAINPGDSIERHFMVSIVGGKWLPDQDLCWRLVTGAVERIRELENEIG